MYKERKKDEASTRGCWTTGGKGCGLHEMNETLIATRTTIPGHILQRELDARGWTQKKLAEMMRCPLKTINMICLGQKRITARMASRLADAFGTSPELWLNLEMQYRLYQARKATRKDKQ